ncbi:uncharacterized protein LOC132170892 isoform X3 [Corylus avellana]|uniref:uncharacterized protein LOC132170892 isoform X3 n=1 Tax=Corylus avellana TaxID=13451 RepID=UPI00286B908F|nr:uncharacterized protein LOC132170892 isoform X3 [Corylus avellana]
MPSLKMKTKLSTGCFKEKNGLHACQKSSKISKKSCSYVRISEHTAEFDTCIPECEDVSLNTQVSIKNIESDGVIDREEFLDEENSQFQNQPSFFVDSATIGRMESAHNSNLETIFSPALEPIDSHTEPKADDDAGNNKDPDMPGLGADESDDNRSSSDYQSCDVSDFYISDMIVASLPYHGNAFDDDNGGANCFPDYKCAEPSLLFDVTEQYMMLPFLEDTVKTSDINRAKSCEEAMLGSDNTSLYLAIDQMRPCNQEFDANSDSDQGECFDPQVFIKNLPELSDVVSNFQPAILPEETQNRKHVTLVLDLDETLVHSTLEHHDDADFTFTVFFNMKEHTVYVKQRPYLHMFLEKVAEMFEVVIFTASQSIYAEQLLDTLDPDGKLISRRVYRESCIFADGSYTKDLTVLGVDLAKVAIIDNSPQVFRLQFNNGIPIKSWFDDPSDSALISLLPFLETLVDAEDVRPIIAKRFGHWKIF